MAKKIFKNWDKTEAEPLLKKIEEKIHKSQPIKERITNIIWKLKLQQEKLENVIAKLQNHDKEIFEKCVEAEMVKDDMRAAIYANECVEIRKMAKIIMLSQLAIEKVILRLETIQEFGDILQGLAPVSHVIKTLKGNLSGIIPEVSYELESIGEMLNGIIVETGKTSEIASPVEVEGEESKKILGEASLVAEQKIRENFPEISDTTRSLLEKNLR